MPNFKVRCTGLSDTASNDNFIIGKTYTTDGGTLKAETGYEFDAWSFKKATFENLKKWFLPQITFELVEDEKVFTKADIQANDFVFLINGTYGRFISFDGGIVLVYENPKNSHDDFRFISMDKIKKICRPNLSYQLRFEIDDGDYGAVIFDREKGIGCEKPKPEFKFEVGDRVKIGSMGNICTTYDEFVKQNSPQYISDFIEDGYPNDSSVFKIVGKGEHKAYVKRPTYVIQDVRSLQVFVFCENGLKAVEEDLW